MSSIEQWYLFLELVFPDAFEKAMQINLLIRLLTSTRPPSLSHYNHTFKQCPKKCAESCPRTTTPTTSITLNTQHTNHLQNLLRQLRTQSLAE